MRLTQCILHGAAAATQMERRLRASAAEQAAAASVLASEGSGGASAAPPLADVAATVAAVLGAGALFPGEHLERAASARCAHGLPGCRAAACCRPLCLRCTALPHTRSLLPPHSSACPLPRLASCPAAA